LLHYNLIVFENKSNLHLFMIFNKHEKRKAS
jgi:hypothetical protein